MAQRLPLLDGARLIKLSILGPGLVSTFLPDLGTDVVKVEPPGSDYIRQMAWLIVDDTSLLHLHTHRGNRSGSLDLRTDDGVSFFERPGAKADVVVEAMRPGSLARLGLGFDALTEVNPRIVFCALSGYGASGPYRDMPSHGIAYDTWAGIIQPVVDDDSFCHIPPDMPNFGINVVPMLEATAILTGVIHARSTGIGCETEQAYRRSETEVTGNASDDCGRCPPGLARMRHGMRYQIYAASNGHVLFMASKQPFWKNFCHGVGRTDLFDKWPGSKFTDHARGNRELQTALREIFHNRTCQEWIAFSTEHNTPIAPVNTPATVGDDPTSVTAHRSCPWMKSGPSNCHYRCSYRAGFLWSRPWPRLRDNTPMRYWSTCSTYSTRISRSCACRVRSADMGPHMHDRLTTTDTEATAAAETAGDHPCWTTPGASL